MYKWNSSKYLSTLAPPPLKKMDALWELFSLKISYFLKTAVLTLEMDILAITIKLSSGILMDIMIYKVYRNTLRGIARAP